MKQPKCEADHSPPINTNANNAWSFTSIPHTALWHRDNTTFISELEE
jgi:hypothetical protein